MDVRIFVETVFENGDVLKHDVGHICRPLVDAARRLSVCNLRRPKVC